MYYGTTIYKYGPSKLALKYTEEELNNLIGIFIADNNEFSFGQLCNYVLSSADQQDMLKKEPHTSYSQIMLTNADTIKICKLLWELIWSKKIMILFNTPQNLYHNSSETFFIVNK